MSQIIDATNVIGGHIRNEGGKGFSFKGFVDFATYLCNQGADKALVKFGKLPAANNNPERTVLRIASIAKDNIFRCDILNPLFRTSATKAVNNDVRKTFINALKKEIGDEDVRRLDRWGVLNLNDFFDEKTANEIRNGEEPVCLSQLFLKIGTKGAGKPLSAREIVHTSEEIENWKTEGAYQTWATDFCEALEGLDKNYVKSRERILSLQSELKERFGKENTAEWKVIFNIVEEVKTAVSRGEKDLATVVDAEIEKLKVSTWHKDLPNQEAVDVLKDKVSKNLLLAKLMEGLEDWGIMTGRWKPKVQVNEPGNIVNENNNENEKQLNLAEEQQKLTDQKKKLTDQQKELFADVERHLQTYYGGMGRVVVGKLYIYLDDVKDVYTRDDVDSNAFNELKTKVHGIIKNVFSQMGDSDKIEDMESLIDTEIGKVESTELKELLQRDPMLNMFKQESRTMKAQHQQNVNVNQG